MERFRLRLLVAHSTIRSLDDLDQDGKLHDRLEAFDLGLLYR
jgi:hypothetical protein